MTMTSFWFIYLLKICMRDKEAIVVENICVCGLHYCLQRTEAMWDLVRPGLAERPEET